MLLELVKNIISTFGNDRREIDMTANGLCLCVLHDKAFDKGYMNLSKDYRVQISSLAEKDEELFNHLQPYRGKRINLPSKQKPNESKVSYGRVS